MEQPIQVSGLVKRYGSLCAVDQVSLSVDRGTVFGLLGANGAGKTTTIECMLGTKVADGGTLSILGMHPVRNRKKLFKAVSVQFQESHYQDQITVAELCQVTAALYPNPAKYSDLLKQFGIGDKARSPVKALSGGQRQRLFIALALIPNPQVVFLDELTTGLDAKARREVWKILLELKQQGLTIFLTSHFMDEVAALCDQIGILKQGKLVFCGTVAQAIAASPYDQLEDAYLWFTDEEGYNNERL